MTNGNIQKGSAYLSCISRFYPLLLPEREEMAIHTVSPEEALARLKAGNQRFVQNNRLSHDLLDQVRETALGQRPFATILGCIDSRAVPELIFDQGIGDLFSIRVAGNVIGDDVLASLEFACTVADTRFILVKGHTSCGAIQSACAGDGGGHLDQMMQKIMPSVEKAKSERGEQIGDSDFRNEVSHLNVLNSVAQIKEQSEILRNLSQNGQIAIIGALYDVRTGVVTFFED